MRHMKLGMHWSIGSPACSLLLHLLLFPLLLFPGSERHSERADRGCERQRAHLLQPAVQRADP